MTGVGNFRVMTSHASLYLSRRVEWSDCDVRLSGASTFLPARSAATLSERSANQPLVHGRAPIGKRLSATRGVGWGNRVTSSRFSYWVIHVVASPV